MWQVFEQLARGMRGGRITSCKSAKDRYGQTAARVLIAMSSLTRPALCVCYSVVLSTSMSITLEQGSSIATFANLKSDDVEDLIRVMRVAGVRRDNVGKNIGARRYAFNGLQVRVWQCPTHAEVSIIVSKLVVVAVARS